MIARIAFCLVWLTTPLAATTVQRFALAALTANAERIVVGVCRQAQPQWVRGQIYTRYVFSVSQVIKGPAIAQLELHLPGGHLQGAVTRIIGMPVFAPGDEAVLFLTAANALGHAWPVGLAQGRFAIKRRAANKPRVFQELDGLALHTESHSAPKKAPPHEPVQGMLLDQFLARVRALTENQTHNAR
ncbi:MAG: hypothetical protein F4Y91_13695 [Gemmatimonadetes bacterium]|nr:hypothetical protein [Gemmatimonadota bacterium]